MEAERECSDKSASIFHSHRSVSAGGLRIQVHQQYTENGLRDGESADGLVGQHLQVNSSNESQQVYPKPRTATTTWCSTAQKPDMHAAEVNITLQNAEAKSYWPDGQ